MIDDRRKPPFWRRIFPAGNIFSAIERGDVEKCWEFLRDDRDAVLNQTDEAGRKPLHAAAHGRRQEIVALLLTAGARLDARDANGATALHWAAVGGDARVIEQLLFAGAELEPVDQNSFTPAQLARMRGHPEIADLLERHVGKR